MMNETLALVILWTAGIVTAAAAVGGMIYWFFFDTSTGFLPDSLAIQRRRESKGYASSYFELEEDDLWVENEYAKACRETRWRRLVTWWNSPA